jgi:hypothetical protein
MQYLRDKFQCCSFYYNLDADEIMHYDHDGDYEGQVGDQQIPHGLGRSVKNDGACFVKQCNSLNLDLIALLNFFAQLFVGNTVAAGTVYEGFWKHGRYHGTGCISNPNTGFVYRGGFKDGQQEGDGLHLHWDGAYDYTYSKQQVDDSGAKDCNSLKRYVDVSVFIL